MTGPTKPALIPWTAKQATAISLCSTHSTVVMEGAVRSGKTESSADAWLDRVLHGPPGELLIAGATRDTIKRNILSMLLRRFGTRRQHWGGNEGTFLGRTVHLVGAPNTLAEERIRGMTLAGALVDEGTLIDEEFFTQLQARLSVEGAWLIVTTNPGAPAHYLYKYLERARTVLHQDGRLENRAVRVTVTRDGARRWWDKDGNELLDLARCRFVLDDNASLSPSYRQRIRNSFSGLFFRRFILGEWVAADGAIYDMYDPKVHEIRELPRRPDGTLAIGHWHLGIDYGSTNPTAATLMGIADDGRLIAVREWRWSKAEKKRGLAPDQQVAELRAWADNGYDGLVPAGTLPLTALTVVMDPSAAPLRLAWLAAGLGKTIAGDNAVLPGIAEVANLLASGRYVQHQSLKHLQTERYGYVWDKKKQDQGLDAPLKTDDHHLDSERYPIRTMRRLLTRIPWTPAGDQAEAA